MSKKSSELLFYTFIVALLNTETLSAQATDSASIIPNESVQQLVKSIVNEQSPLFNGRQYIAPEFNPNYGHPFFETTEWIDGTIMYGGVLYENLPLLYDIVQDQIVTRHPTNPDLISLVKEKVDFFKIKNSTFFYIEPTQNNVSKISPGFYSLLFSGKLSVYLKREKRARTSANNSPILKTKFKSLEQYYIQKDGLYYKINNVQDVIDLLGKGKEVQQFLRDNNLSFKHEPEVALVKIAMYYSQAAN